MATAETLDPDSSPAKRLKLTDPHPNRSPSPSSETLIPSESASFSDEYRPQSCGICLSSEGTTIRGKIDCCDHYYCFVCVIDWSKIESRCPICKCRFRGIWRVRKDGSVVGDRAVPVPVRDQFPDPVLEEDSDPYAHVRCTSCRSTTDESLLLVCDLCNTPVHTYCVGLGATAPEGDWYCEDCVTVRAELLNIETGSDFGMSTPHHVEGAPPDRKLVSVFDIVNASQKPRTRGVHRLLRLVNPRKSWSLPIASSNSADLGRERRTVVKAFHDSRAEVMDSDTRTWSRCRNVNEHIRDLRENWASFQRGTLCFSTNMLGSNGKSSVGVDATSSDESHAQVSLSPSYVSSKVNIARNKDKRRDVHRAWKQLNIARSKLETETEHDSLKKLSETPLSKSWTSSYSNNLMKDHTALGSLPSKYKDRGSTAQQICLPLGKTGGRSICQGPEKKQHVPRSLDGATPSINNKLLSSSESQKFFLARVHQEDRTSIESDGKVNSLSSNVSNLLEESPCTSTSAQSTATFTYSRGKFTGKSLSPKDVKYPGAVSKEGETCSGLKFREDSGAKSEIQSLVKLNLKMLTRGKQIGVHEFKDVARHSTHVILQACRLQPQDTGDCPGKSSICLHLKGNEQSRKSTLMPDLCRECFYAFVMSAVHSAMSLKLGLS